MTKIYSNDINNKFFFKIIFKILILMNVIKKNVTLKKKVIINVKLLQSIHRIDSLTVNKTLLIVSFSNSSNLLFF